MDEAVAAQGTGRGILLRQGVSDGQGRAGSRGDVDECSGHGRGMAAAFMGREGHVGDLDRAGGVRGRLEGAGADDLVIRRSEIASPGWLPWIPGEKVERLLEERAGGPGVTAKGRRELSREFADIGAEADRLQPKRSSAAFVASFARRGNG